MNNVKEVAILAEQIVILGTALAEIGKVLKRIRVEAPVALELEAVQADEPTKTETVKVDEPAKMTVPKNISDACFSKEEVRIILANKANEEAGRFKADVKALVRKYSNGRGKLGDVDEQNYAALVSEVEALKSEENNQEDI